MDKAEVGQHRALRDGGLVRNKTVVFVNLRLAGRARGGISQLPASGQIQLQICGVFRAYIAAFLYLLPSIYLWYLLQVFICDI